MIENRGFLSKFRVRSIYIAVALLGLVCLFPLWNIVAVSFSGSAAVHANRVGLWPVNFTPAAYSKILDDNQFWRSFLISAVRVVLTLVINLVLIVLMAYPLTKNKREFRGRNIYMNLLIFAMLFNGGMIPSYMLVRSLGLINSIWSLILPGALPIFSVILAMNFFHTIPKSLEEAAFIDGATPPSVLVRIIVPCSKPCLATIALFSFVGSWNDFFSGLIYILKPENYPIMTYIQSLNIDIQEMLRHGMSGNSAENLAILSNRNLNAAKIIVAVIPLLLVYPLLQKYLITGIVMGSVKE